MESMSSYTDVGEEQGYLLHKYAKSGNKKQVKKILNNGIQVDYLNSNGQSPLYVACFEGKEAVVDCLLQHGADPNQRDKEGSTPVHAAGYSGSVAVLSRLIEMGGDLRLHDRQSRTIKNWIMMQKDNKKKKKMLEFLEKTRHFAMTNSGMDLLHEHQSNTYLNRAASSFVSLFKTKSSHQVLNCSTDSTHSLGYGKVYFGKNNTAGTSGYIQVIPEDSLKHDEYGISYNNGAFMVMESMQLQQTRMTVKRLHVNPLGGGVVDLLINENEHMAKLRHPYILLLMGISPTNNLDGLLLAFESVGLGSLYIYLHTKMETVTAFNVAQIMEQISDAVLYIHNQGYIHCCITSHAIQLVSPRLAKLANFEYMVANRSTKNACSLIDVTTNTYKHAAYNWMAPELMTGLNQVSVDSDLYSLCAVIWEMFIGEIPWHLCSANDIIEEIVKRKSTLTIDEKRIPQPFYNLLVRGLDLNPYLRRTTFEQVRNMCASYLVDNDYNSLVLSPAAVQVINGEIFDKNGKPISERKLKDPSLSNQDLTDDLKFKSKGAGKKLKKLEKKASVKKANKQDIPPSKDESSSPGRKKSFSRGAHLGILMTDSSKAATKCPADLPQLSPGETSDPDDPEVRRWDVICDSRQPNAKSESKKDSQNNNNSTSSFKRFSEFEIFDSKTSFRQQPRIPSPSVSPVLPHKVSKPKKEDLVNTVSSSLNASFRSNLSDMLNRSSSSFLEMDQYENQHSFKPASHRLSGESCNHQVTNKPSLGLWSSLPRGYKPPSSTHSISSNVSSAMDVNRFRSRSYLGSNEQRPLTDSSYVSSCDTLESSEPRLSPRLQQAEWFGGSSSLRNLITNYQHQANEHERRQSILVLNSKSKTRDVPYPFAKDTRSAVTVPVQKHVSTVSITLKPSLIMKNHDSENSLTKLVLQKSHQCQSIKGVDSKKITHTHQMSETKDMVDERHSQVHSEQGRTSEELLATDSQSREKSLNDKSGSKTDGDNNSLDIEDFYFDDVIDQNASKEKHLCLQQVTSSESVHDRKPTDHEQSEYDASNLDESEENDISKGVENSECDQVDAEESMHSDEDTEPQNQACEPRSLSCDSLHSEDNMDLENGTCEPDDQQEDRASSDVNSNKEEEICNDNKSSDENEIKAVKSGEKQSQIKEYQNNTDSGYSTETGYLTETSKNK